MYISSEILVHFTVAIHQIFYNHMISGANFQNFTVSVSLAF